jgi:uncharacterized membrane protein
MNDDIGKNAPPGAQRELPEGMPPAGAPQGMPPPSPAHLNPGLRFGASVSLVALIVLCVLWETVLAPVRPGGTLLALKALPLLLPLRGVLRGNLYTFQWASMLMLLYFMEGIVRATSDPGFSANVAWVEVLLSTVFFWCAVLYVRPAKRAHKQAKSAAESAAKAATAQVAARAAASTTPLHSAKPSSTSAPRASGLSTSGSPASGSPALGSAAAVTPATGAPSPAAPPAAASPDKPA